MLIFRDIHKYWNKITKIKFLLQIKNVKKLSFFSKKMTKENHIFPKKM